MTFIFQIWSSASPISSPSLSSYITSYPFVAVTDRTTPWKNSVGPIRSINEKHTTNLDSYIRSRWLFLYFDIVAILGLEASSDAMCVFPAAPRCTWSAGEIIGWRVDFVDCGYPSRRGHFSWRIINVSLYKSEQIRQMLGRAAAHWEVIPYISWYFRHDQFLTACSPIPRVPYVWSDLHCIDIHMAKPWHFCLSCQCDVLFFFIFIFWSALNVHVDWFGFVVEEM